VTYSWRQLGLLTGGCAVLGLGVALLLLPALGSDGFSTLVNGIRLSADIPFMVSNTLVSAAFIALAWVRRLPPGLGTVVQILVVGATAAVFLEVIPEPEAMPARVAMLCLALPVVALGIAAYLGSQTGAGPAEAAALAWDPPVPFRWSYSFVQGGGAIGGWLLGAAIGPGTIAVIVLLGPAVDVVARLLGLQTAQPRSDRAVEPDRCA
jgi:uncharacterized membrane protein YczE